MDKLVEQFEQLKVTTSSRRIDDDTSIKELIETYSKAVLDCTFFHENYLTENNFRLESTEEDIATTINLLNAIVSLCASVDTCNNNTTSDNDDGNVDDDNDNDGEDSNGIEDMSSSFQGRTSAGDSYRSVVNVLGIEFGECVLWRQGSLLYAFCSAKLSSDPGWVCNNQIQLLNHLRDGINYFHLMLSLRRNLISTNLDGDRDNNASPFMSSDHHHHPGVPRYSRDDQGTMTANTIDPESSIAYVSAKDFNPSNINELGKLLVQKQQIVGALGQELDQLQQVLDEQELLHMEAREEIQREMIHNPECRTDLERALDEINASQERIREQQEKNVEKKGQIEDCLRRLREQEEKLNQQSTNTFHQSAPNRLTSGPNARDIGSSVNTFDLIDMGILSDTHMLAMMYCGDMAFWYCKYSLDWNLMNQHSSREILNEIRHLGTSYLKIYVKAVERVLRFNGWNCDRAKELLKYFDELW